MTVFGIVSDSVLKDIKLYQVACWDFGNFFVLFGIPKMIIVDADGLFSGIFKKTFHYTLLILVHSI